MAVDTTHDAPHPVPVAEQACHHAQGPTPSPANHDSSQSSHDLGNPCAQAQVFEFKTAVMSKCVLQQQGMYFDVEPVCVQQTANPAAVFDVRKDALPASTPSRLVLALRI